MPPRRLHALVVLALLVGVSQAEAQKAIFVVRHAEKVDESSDAALSAEGKARAQRLARHLEAAGVSAVYATRFRRTVDTAEPLATRVGLRVNSVALEASELAELLRTKHANDVVLVVGHSNTVPAILAQLGHTEKVAIAAEQFDDLFVVTPRPSGAPAVVRLKY
jgi:broad specificity phosphatase PhoE